MEKQWRVDRIPILQDNFVYILNDGVNAIVVDPGTAEPVIEFLQERHLNCQAILITHHHSDHIGGLLEIEKTFHCRVYAPKKNQRQLHFGITDFISEADRIEVADLKIQIIELPGHTHGHLAYWIPEKKWLFSGDVLFALGCGRVFEGTYQEMFQSLQKIKSLPDETLVYCTHDYFPANERFSQQQGFSLQGYHSQLPLSLKQEKAFNPFLKAQDVEIFSEIRDKRNQF